MPKRDLTNMRFGRLLVLGETNKRLNRNIIWKCICDCGNEKYASGISLVTHRCMSCGCLRHDLVTEKNYKHGLSQMKLYRVWSCMKGRCERHTDKEFHNYGARGIKVCQEWHDFQAFYEWAMQSGYDPKAKKGDCTLDRIDVNGDYTPSNCRWISTTYQQRNKRNTRYLVYKGEKKPLIDWAELKGISYHTLASRIYDYHWTVERALETPVRPLKRRNYGKDI